LTDLDEERPLIAFDAYDKRTWLVSWRGLEEEIPVVSEQEGGTSLDEENQNVLVLDILTFNQLICMALLVFCIACIPIIKRAV